MGVRGRGEILCPGIIPHFFFFQHYSSLFDPSQPQPLDVLHHGAPQSNSAQLLSLRCEPSPTALFGTPQSVSTLLVSACPNTSQRQLLTSRLLRTTRRVPTCFNSSPTSLLTSTPRQTPLFNTNSSPRFGSSLFDISLLKTSRHQHRSASLRVPKQIISYHLCANDSALPKPPRPGALRLNSVPINSLLYLE